MKLLKAQYPKIFSYTLNGLSSDSFRLSLIIEFITYAAKTAIEEVESILIESTIRGIKSMPRLVMHYLIKLRTMMSIKLILFETF